MQYALIGVALLILIVSTTNGFFKGFIRTALGMAAMLVALVLVYLLGPTVSRILREQTPLYEWTSEAVQESLVDSLDLTALASQEERREMLNQSFLPQVLVDGILARTEGVEGVPVADVFLQQVGDYVAEIVVTILGGVITFLLAFLAIRLALALGGLIGSVPGLHLVNQLGGALLGAIRGVFLLWLLCFVVTIFAPTTVGQEVLRAIEESYFLRIFYSGALSFGSVLRLGLLLI